MELARLAPVIRIVDDDPSVRRALTLLLRGHGFRVETSASAEHALQAARGGQPLWAVLVLDIDLGATCGFDLYERLRSLGLAVPTIFMTGRDDARLRERASRFGDTAYLVKPFEHTLLLDAIARALPSHAP